MGEGTSKAQLIDASEIGERSQRIPATMSRKEIEEASRFEGPPELILEIDRRSNGDVEAHTLRVAWTEGQLKQLLHENDGDEITLFFDTSELERALVDEDVEGHGVREKSAAALTVAAMAAGLAATAHPAAAKTMVSGGGGTGAGTTIEMVSDAASSGVAASPELISDAASSGPAVVQAAEASGPELVSDAGSGGPAVVQSAEASGPELVSDTALTGTPSPAQSTASAGTVATASTADSGLSTSEIAAAAAGAGLVLLITAAGFSVRSRRQHEQPA
jgi:hypothetical protein